jgi:hypothetical protein
MSSFLPTLLSIYVTLGELPPRLFHPKSIDFCVVVDGGLRVTRFDNRDSASPVGAAAR